MSYEAHSFDQGRPGLEGRAHPHSAHTNPLALGAENGSCCLSPAPQPAPPQIWFLLSLEVTMSSDHMEKENNFLVHEVENDAALFQ